MIRVCGENTVGLRLRERGRTGHFGDAAHVVARVEILLREHLVGRDTHLGEELDAVLLAFGVEPHDPVVQPVGAFAWGERRDIRRAHWRIARRRAVATGRAVGGRRDSDVALCCGWAAEALSGDERNERKQRDAGHRPRERRGESARLKWDEWAVAGGSARRGGSGWRATAMAEFCARRQRGMTGGAGRALERRAARGAETPGRYRATSGTVA